jgi:arsenite methyltransferase
MDNHMESPLGGCCSPGPTGQHADHTLKDDMILEEVRAFYAARARSGSTCCGSAESVGDLEGFSQAIGYSASEVHAVPDGANLGLGCGNPTALDAIPEGATVVDLGSGAGFDCFLAARQVGPAGEVIGIDMTPEMIDRARQNALSGGFANVRFVLSEIESLPLPDASADFVISNCVINLSPDKQRVFDEAFRVLRPGGRLMVSDLVLTGELPERLRRSAAVYAACIGGAELRQTYLERIAAAGFQKIVTDDDPGYIDAIMGGAPDAGLTDALRDVAAAGVVPVVSLKVFARKPDPGA